MSQVLLLISCKSIRWTTPGLLKSLFLLSMLWKYLRFWIVDSLLKVLWITVRKCKIYHITFPSETPMLSSLMLINPLWDTSFTSKALGLKRGVKENKIMALSSYTMKLQAQSIQMSKNAAYHSRSKTMGKGFSSEKTYPGWEA